MTEKRRYYEYIAGLCRAMTLLVTALFVFIPVSTKAQITDYGYSNGKPTVQHSIFFAPQVKEELRAVCLTTVMGLDWRLRPAAGRGAEEGTHRHPRQICGSEHQHCSVADTHPRQCDISFQD